MSARRFRKRPVVIEAVRWTGENRQEILDFIGMSGHWQAGRSGFRDEVGGAEVVIYTLEGNHVGRIGDWIIRGVKGEFYPCKPDIFAATYEPVEGGTPAPAPARQEDR